MSWELSTFKAGDLVEVRSREEILATLDARGRLDGLPFMPEMLQYCGRQFRVGAVAHKACDMIVRPGSARRLDRTVHLTGLRCDGSAHGGCQAECNLYWKDAWLKRPGAAKAAPTGARVSTASAPRCDEARLQVLTRSPEGATNPDALYVCQATHLPDATKPLAWWDPRQYLFDVVTRNHSGGAVLGRLFLSSLRRVLARLPVGYRAFERFSDRMHLRLTGRPMPSLHAKVPDSQQTPTGTLGLQPGEYVRIKSQAEIEATLRKDGRNRGLSFDPEEMAPFCGRVFRVRRSVTHIVDEKTGRFIQMRQPCIMLDGVYCKAEYASCRLNCPRAIPSFWREIWLERVPAPEGRTPLEPTTTRAETPECVMTRTASP